MDILHIGHKEICLILWWLQYFCCMVLPQFIEPFLIGGHMVCFWCFAILKNGTMTSVYIYISLCIWQIHLWDKFLEIEPVSQRACVTQLFSKRIAPRFTLTGFERTSFPNHWSHLVLSIVLITPGLYFSYSSGIIGWW